MISYSLYLIAIVSLVFNLVRLGGISIPDATFFASLIFVIVGEGLHNKASIRVWLPAHPLVIPSFLILAGGLVSSINAFSLSTSVGITLKQFYIFSVFISLGVYWARNRNINTLVSALIFSGILTSSAAIYDYLVGYKATNEFLMRLGSIPLNESWDRYAGLLGHPNEQAMFLAVILPLSFSRFLNSFHEKLVDTAFHFLILIILGTALFLTGSISGYLSVIFSSVICIVWFFYSVTKTDLFLKNVLSRVLIGGFVSVVLLIGLFNTSQGYRFIHSDFFAQSPVSDLVFSSMDRVITTTAITRWEDYMLGLKYLSDHPFIGAGMDQSGTGGLDSSQLVTALAIHNTILQSWVAGGMLAFLGTIMIYFNVLKYACKSLGQAFSSKTFSILVGLSASSLGFVIIDMTSSNIYQRVKWLVFAMLIGLVLDQSKSTHHLSAEEVNGKQ